MELYKKTCKNQMCGKTFMGTRTQQYCCPDCRVPTYKPKRKYKRIKNCTLGEVATQAKKLGTMTPKMESRNLLAQMMLRLC